MKNYQKGLELKLRENQLTLVEITIIQNDKFQQRNGNKIFRTSFISFLNKGESI